MYIKTHLCEDMENLIYFLTHLNAELLTVKQIEYIGADGQTYRYEVRYK